MSATTAARPARGPAPGARDGGPRHDDGGEPGWRSAAPLLPEREVGRARARSREERTIGEVKAWR